MAVVSRAKGEHPVSRQWSRCTVAKTGVGPTHYQHIIRHNKIVNPGTVPAAYPVAAIGLDRVSDTLVSDNEVIIGKGNPSKAVSLIGGCDPDTVRIDNNQTRRTP